MHAPIVAPASLLAFQGIVERDRKRVYRLALRQVDVQIVLRINFHACFMEPKHVEKFPLLLVDVLPSCVLLQDGYVLVSAKGNEAF